jgi:hypothetical protein
MRLNLVYDAGGSQWLATNIPSTASSAVGIIDGSNAAPGQIGEFLINTQTATGSLSNGGFINITSLPLSAGDWEVGGTVFFNISVGVTYLAGWLAQNGGVANTPGFASNAASSGLGSQTLNLSHMRINAGAQTVYITTTANFTSGTVLVNGSVWARRMR